jgi:HK97 family phage prohead protease
MTDIFDKLAPGRYRVTDEGRVVKHSDIGKELILQGVATEFGKPFVHGDKVVILESGCFDASIKSGDDVQLLLDHQEGHSLGTMNSGRLQLHVGEKALVFRFLIPESSRGKFADLADQYDCYVPVSIGYSYNAASDTDVEIIDGVKVLTVRSAKLTEISILSKPPAVSTTYARVATWETCGELAADYEMGRFDLVGKVVSLHRKVNANGGEIRYAHTPSPYQRAGNAFLRTLEKYNPDQPRDSHGRFGEGGGGQSGSDATTAGSIVGAAATAALQSLGKAMLLGPVAIFHAITVLAEIGLAILVAQAIVSTFSPSILPDSARANAVSKSVPASVDAFIAGLSEVDAKRICDAVLPKLTDDQLRQLGAALLQP